MSNKIIEYNDMRAKKRPPKSFGNRLDLTLKKIGAKSDMYHGGRLYGVSVQRIIKGHKELFLNLEATISTICNHTYCKINTIEVTNVMKQYGVLFT